MGYYMYYTGGMDAHEGDENVFLKIMFLMCLIVLRPRGRLPPSTRCRVQQHCS